MGNQSSQLAAPTEHGPETQQSQPVDMQGARAGSPSGSEIIVAKKPHTEILADVTSDKTPKKRRQTEESADGTGDRRKKAKSKGKDGKPKKSRGRPRDPSLLKPEGAGNGVEQQVDRTSGQVTQTQDGGIEGEWLRRKKKAKTADDVDGSRNSLAERSPLVEDAVAGAAVQPEAGTSATITEPVGKVKANKRRKANDAAASAEDSATAPAQEDIDAAKPPDAVDYAPDAVPMEEAKVKKRKKKVKDDVVPGDVKASHPASAEGAMAGASGQDVVAEHAPDEAAVKIIKKRKKKPREQPAKAEHAVEVSRSLSNGQSATDPPAIQEIVESAKAEVVRESTPQDAVTNSTKQPDVAETAHDEEPVKKTKKRKRKPKEEPTVANVNAVDAVHESEQAQPSQAALVENVVPGACEQPNDEKTAPADAPMEQSKKRKKKPNKPRAEVPTEAPNGLVLRRSTVDKPTSDNSNQKRAAEGPVGQMTHQKPPPGSQAAAAANSPADDRLPKPAAKKRKRAQAQGEAGPVDTHADGRRISVMGRPGPRKMDSSGVRAPQVEVEDAVAGEPVAMTDSADAVLGPPGQAGGAEAARRAEGGEPDQTYRREPTRALIGECDAGVTQFYRHQERRRVDRQSPSRNIDANNNIDVDKVLADIQFALEDFRRIDRATHSSDKARGAKATIENLRNVGEHLHRHVPVDSGALVHAWAIVADMYWASPPGNPITGAALMNLYLSRSRHEESEEQHRARFNRMIETRNTYARALEERKGVAVTSNVEPLSKGELNAVSAPERTGEPADEDEDWAVDDEQFASLPSPQPPRPPPKGINIDRPIRASLPEPLENGPQKGPFTDAEKAATDDVFDSICQDFHLDSYEVRCQMIDWKNLSAELKAGLSAALPNRTKTAIRKFCQRRYIPRDSGPWGKEEDEMLLKARAEQGDHWQDVAEFVGERTAQQCRDRYRDILKYGEGRQTGPWSQEEEAKLVGVVRGCLEEIRSANVEKGDLVNEAEELEKVVSWNAVSERMGGERTRKRCMEKWWQLRRRDPSLLDTLHDASQPADTAVTVATATVAQPFNKQSKTQRAAANKYQAFQTGDIYDVLVEIATAIPDHTKTFPLESTLSSIVAQRNPESRFNGALRRRAYHEALGTYGGKRCVEAEGTVAGKARAMKEWLERWRERKGAGEFGRGYALQVKERKKRKREGKDDEGPEREEEPAVKKSNAGPKPKREPLSAEMVEDSDDKEGEIALAAKPRSVLMPKDRQLSDDIVDNSDNDEDGAAVGPAPEDHEDDDVAGVVPADDPPAYDEVVEQVIPETQDVPETQVQPETGGGLEGMTDAFVEALSVSSPNSRYRRRVSRPSLGRQEFVERCEAVGKGSIERFCGRGWRGGEGGEV